MKKVKAVSLDKLIEDFSLLEQKITELQGNNNILDIKLDEASRLLKLGQTKETCMKEECATLQATIQGLQETIQTQCDLRDENEELKKNTRTYEEKNKIKEQAHTSHVERIMMEMKAMEQDHKTELAEVQSDMRRKSEMKETELKDAIVRKEAEIQAMKKQLKDQEREKQSEIIKLQMEFNAKLARIQSTSVKAQHQDPSILAQNIFKRKLQFLQEEKNRETEALRRTIKELEQQLNSPHDSRLKRRRF
ncbi:coiled-coil domain-containing protein 152-like isoform X1 [Acipenser ruthenus]|uniref:coiled-coil domain-containing protein 152-like isoform X1 n=1 Tax=Acipenser ruthenus TaxID=7906 RepID=UPI0027425193|nr:coiled-coil domain-containing protein 152-like isoform X1 [Acipenser ruthenus]